MSSPSSEFALLLPAPDPTEAELARGLLESAGIPSILHGQDRDLAELGHAIHTGVARPDLFVPKTALERARSVLGEAWDKASLTDEMALGAENQEEEFPRTRRSALLWSLFVGIVALVLFFTLWRFYSLRPV